MGTAPREPPPPVASGTLSPRLLQAPRPRGVAPRPRGGVHVRGGRPPGRALWACDSSGASAKPHFWRNGEISAETNEPLGLCPGHACSQPCEAPRDGETRPGPTASHHPTPTPAAPLLPTPPSGPAPGASGSGSCPQRVGPSRTRVPRVLGQTRRWPPGPEGRAGRRGLEWHLHRPRPPQPLPPIVLPPCLAGAVGAEGCPEVPAGAGGSAPLVPPPPRQWREGGQGRAAGALDSRARASELGSGGNHWAETGGWGCSSLLPRGSCLCRRQRRRPLGFPSRGPSAGRGR